MYLYIFYFDRNRSAAFYDNGKVMKLFYLTNLQQLLHQIF